MRHSLVGADIVQYTPTQVARHERTMFNRARMQKEEPERYALNMAKEWYYSFNRFLKAEGLTFPDVLNAEDEFDLTKEERELYVAIKRLLKVEYDRTQQGTKVTSNPSGKVD